jgi:hypothetical protein
MALVCGSESGPLWDYLFERHYQSWNLAFFGYVSRPKKDHGHGLCPNRGPIACGKHEKLRTRSASRLMGIASCSAETMLAMSLLATTASLFGLR